MKTTLQNQVIKLPHSLRELFFLIITVVYNRRNFKKEEGLNLLRPPVEETIKPITTLNSTWQISPHLPIGSLFGDWVEKNRFIIKKRNLPKLLSRYLMYPEENLVLL